MSNLSAIRDEVRILRALLTPAPRAATIRAATFNVNMNAPLAAQKRNIRRLFAAPVDVVALQETNRLDLPAMVAAGWHVHQDRSSRGKANTAVMWRDTLTATRTGIAPYIDSPTDDLGARFIAWVEFEGLGIVASAHRQPKRDDDDWDDSDDALRAWATPFPRLLVGMDSNVNRHASLEAATGLSWRGIGYDGFLSRGHTLATPVVLADVASDHPCVTTTVKE